MNSRSELEWKRSVEETMITPSATRATRLSTDCETRVPSSTGQRLAHPARAPGEDHRPSRLAEARRQRRRHQYPDHGRRGDVAAAQGAARQRRAWQSSTRNWRGGTSRPSSAPVATRTQVASERTMLLTTWSTPTRRAAMKVSPRPISAATPTPTRRAVRWRSPLRAGSGSSEGRRRARTGGLPSEGATPMRRATRSPVVLRPGHLERSLVDGLDLARRPAARRSAAPTGGPRPPSARAARGRRSAPAGLSASRCGSAGGTRIPSWPSLTTSA